MISLLLAQYLGAAVTVASIWSDGFEFYRLQREVEFRPVATGLFILVYLLAQAFFWYSAGPLKLRNWRSWFASDSDGWWPTGR